LREQGALPGADVFQGLTQTRLCGGDGGIGRQRLSDQRGDLRRMEQGPPFARDIASDIQPLRRATRGGRGNRLGRQWRFRQARIGWRLRPMVIRADGAAAKRAAANTKVRRRRPRGWRETGEDMGGC
jgi:hypothetical protein